MKKGIVLVLALTMVLSMCGCGSNVPDDLTKETYRLGKKALEVMDSFLSDKIDVNEADEQLSDIFDALVAERESIKNSSDKNSNVKYRNNEMISFYINSFSSGMHSTVNGPMTDCQKSRDSLEMLLNMS